MKAFKYEYSVAEEGKLISIQRNAKEIQEREGISIQEATKKATLIALSRRKRKSTGKTKKSKTKAKSGNKKKGSMFDYIGEKLSGK